MGKNDGEEGSIEYLPSDPTRVYGGMHPESAIAFSLKIGPCILFYIDEFFSAFRV